MSATYKVVARRWTRGWELHIEGVGVTQATRLNDAEAMVRDYIARDRGVNARSFKVEIRTEIGDGLDESIAEARGKLREAELAQKNAAERSRDIVRRLKDKGLSGIETAKVLGVTPQRVSQLLKGTPGPALTTTSSMGRKTTTARATTKDDRDLASGALSMTGKLGMKARARDTGRGRRRTDGVAAESKR